MKRGLARFRAPDEPGSEERAWAVVRRAYEQRLPARRRSYRRPTAAAAVGVVLAGALALSPAGATVGRLISRALGVRHLGVRHAAPALFSLPSPGQLLVSGSAGTWTVGPDGSTRRLGRWSQASWSPHGLYLAVVGKDELAAVSPRGVPQWTLVRPRVSDPRWYSPTGYRVAYLSAGELRVVAGDGTGDHLLALRVAPVAPTWRPGHPYQLAYLGDRGRIVVRDADTERIVWSAAPRSAVHELAWLPDGARLLAITSRGVLTYGPGGRLIAAQPTPGGGSIEDAALSPDARTLALVSGGADGAMFVEGVAGDHRAPHRVLAGSGLGQVAFSPDSRWLLLSWPAADQWVFVRVFGGPRISAVSRIAQQFSAGARRHFPELEGWCCSAAGAAG